MKNFVKRMVALVLVMAMIVMAAGNPGDADVIIAAAKRGTGDTYHADGSGYGHFGDIKDKNEAFAAGDVVYLDITGYTNWAKSNAKMYVNFTDANKKDNDGKSIVIAEADSRYLSLDRMDEEVEKNIYKFTVTEKLAGSSVLRFWRGNSKKLWNNSITLTYDDFSAGKNCVVVTGWNESGYADQYTETDWENMDMTKDEDADDVPDYIEESLGTDTDSKDTDADGLSDYLEIYVTGTDPIYADTDKNGVADGDEDGDGDGLTNLEEVAYGTDPAAEDTDGDSLTDYEEIHVYGTNPLSADTDQDGAEDGTEVSLGTDPLTADESFEAYAEAGDTDTVKASVAVELSGEQLATLLVEQYEDETLFPKEMPGYIGGCYEFSVDGSFDEATIQFEFEKTLLEDSEFEPIIYYFNESEQKLEAIDTTVKGNVASATITHFPNIFF